MIEESAQGHEGLDGQAWHRRIIHLAAREWIEPPRGHSELKASLEVDDQTLGMLPS